MFLSEITMVKTVNVTAKKILFIIECLSDSAGLWLAIWIDSLGLSVCKQGVTWDTAKALCWAAAIELFWFWRMWLLELQIAGYVLNSEEWCGPQSYNSDQDAKQFWHLLLAFKMHSSMQAKNDWIWNWTVSLQHSQHCLTSSTFNLPVKNVLN